jgi:hypothetical protein
MISLLPSLSEHDDWMDADSMSKSAGGDDLCIDVANSARRALKYQLLPEQNTTDAVRLRYVCDVEIDRV